MVRTGTTSPGATTSSCFWKSRVNALLTAPVRLAFSHMKRAMFATTSEVNVAPSRRLRASGANVIGEVSTFGCSAGDCLDELHAVDRAAVEMVIVAEHSLGGGEAAGGEELHCRLSRLAGARQVRLGHDGENRVAAHVLGEPEAARHQQHAEMLPPVLRLDGNLHQLDVLAHPLEHRETYRRPVKGDDGACMVVDLLHPLLVGPRDVAALGVDVDQVHHVFGPEAAKVVLAPQSATKSWVG